MFNFVNTEVTEVEQLEPVVENTAPIQDTVNGYNFIPDGVGALINDSEAIDKIYHLKNQKGGNNK